MRRAQILKFCPLALKPLADMVSKSEPIVRQPDLALAGQIAESWIGAAFEISLVHHFLEDEVGSTEKRPLMFKLGDFQLATELAYSRLYDQANGHPGEKSAPSFIPLLVCSADAHSLLVFASGYWRALRDLSRVMPFVELADLVRENQATIRETTVARNHIEHITERIVSGRKARPNVPEMPIAVFQESIGRLEFPSIVFGDEAFDLAKLSAAVLTAGNGIAATLESCFESGTRKYLKAFGALACPE